MMFPLLSANSITTGGVHHLGTYGASRAFSGTVTGTGAVSATVVIEVSNDGDNWLQLGVITLIGVAAATDGFASNAPWVFTRANVTAISGTGASVSVTMGV